jgi:cytochrome c oxidase cbb3-type subunit 3
MSHSNNDSENQGMKGHSYDGITELDNPLPSWWLWTFLLTIIFSFIYYIHYESGAGHTLNQELDIALKEISQSKSHSSSHNHDVMQPTETEESLASQMNGEAMVLTGASVYEGKCLACHGKDLQGIVGPNLVDKYWIHGKGTRADIVSVIRAGVLDKGMPAWEPLLKKEEIYAITAFILSKKGSDVPNAKAPQGELVE